MSDNTETTPLRTYAVWRDGDTGDYRAINLSEVYAQNAMKPANARTGAIAKAGAEDFMVVEIQATSLADARRQAPEKIASVEKTIAHYHAVIDRLREESPIVIPSTPAFVEKLAS